MAAQPERGPYRRKYAPSDTYYNATRPTDENAISRQLLRDAVYTGEIDQMNTRVVAERFDCSLILTRTTLRAIVLGISNDHRFWRNEAQPTGVYIGDGRTFDCQLLPNNELFWFLSEYPKES